jgi:hypothetical protein
MIEEIELKISFHKIKPKNPYLDPLIRFKDGPISELSITEESAVSLETNLTALDKNYGEIFLFSLFSIRQIVNFGVSDKISRNLANSLIKSSEEILNITEGHSFDILNELAKLLKRERDILGYSRYRLSDILGHRLQKQLVLYNIGTPKLSEHYRESGRYFIAKLRWIIGRINFRCRPKGLLLSLGIGINYYVPTAVIVLLRFLVHNHFNDKAFLLRIAHVSKVIGMFVFDNKLSISNQLERALDISNLIYYADDKDLSDIAEELLKDRKNRDSDR